MYDINLPKWLILGFHVWERIEIDIVVVRGYGNSAGIM
jgi:hypothetical protein